MRYKIRLIELVGLSILLNCLAAFAESRVALVVGNNNYEHTPALQNPVNDAKAVTAAFKRMGFKVLEGLNLDRSGFEDLLYDFGQQAEQADMAVVFYAGHGIQVNGRNYLLPVDAQLNHIRDLRRQIDLNTVLSEVGLAKRLGLVIVDACRDNPLATTLTRSLSSSRSANIGRGLARVDRTPPNTLVAFATEADAVAADGVENNSPYTKALIKHLETPGLELRLLFGKVRDTVIESTNGQQTPFTYGSLGGKTFYFMPTLPERVKFQLRECAAYLQTNQLDKAVNCYQPILKQYPDNEEATTGLEKAAGKYAENAKQVLDNSQNFLEKIKANNATVQTNLWQLAKLFPKYSQLDQLNIRLAETVAAISGRGTTDGSDKELAQLAERLREITLERDELAAKLARSNNDQHNTSNETSVLKRQFEEAQMSIDELAQSLADAETEGQELTDIINSKQRDFGRERSDLKKQLKESQTQIDELTQALADAEAESKELVDIINQKHRSSKQDDSVFKNKISSLERRIENWQRENKSLSEEIKQNRLDEQAPEIEKALNLQYSQRIEIQTALTALGFNTKGTDGVFGQNTRDAIANYQEKNNYPATGYLTLRQIKEIEEKDIDRELGLDNIGKSFSALAVSVSKSGQYKWAGRRHRTRQGAEKIAFERCKIYHKGANCKIITTFSNKQCIGLAFKPKSDIWSWSLKNSKMSAVESAIAQCGEDCRAKSYGFCTDTMDYSIKRKYYSVAKLWRKGKKFYWNGRSGDSQESSEEKALSACKKSSGRNCKILTTLIRGKEKCIGLSYDSVLGSNWSYAIKSSRKEAVRSAYKSCGKQCDHNFTACF